MNTCFKKIQIFKKGFLLVLDNIDDIGKNHSHEFAKFLQDIV